MGEQLRNLQEPIRALAEEVEKLDAASDNASSRARSMTASAVKRGMHVKIQELSEMCATMRRELHHASLTAKGLRSFRPSTEWREVPDGAACPPGLEYRMDLA